MDFNPDYDFLVTQSKADCFCSSAPFTFTVNGSGPIPTHSLSYIGSCAWTGTLTICSFNYLARLSVCYGCISGNATDWDLTYINLDFPDAKAWNAVYYKLETTCNPNPMFLFYPQGADYTNGIFCNPLPLQHWPTNITLS